MNNTSTHTGIFVLSLLAIIVIEYSLVSTSPKSQTNNAKVNMPTFHW